MEYINLTDAELSEFYTFIKNQEKKLQRDEKFQKNALAGLYKVVRNDEMRSVIASTLLEFHLHGDGTHSGEAAYLAGLSIGYAMCAWKRDKQEEADNLDLSTRDFGDKA